MYISTIPRALAPRYQRTRRPMTLGSLGAGVAQAGVAAPFTAGLSLLAAPIIGLLSSLNNPYGDCSTKSKDMITYLNCWKHAVPDNFIPYPGCCVDSKPAPGWGWAYCPGAKGGSNGKDYLAKNANFPGCGPGCDCTGRKCICAAPGQTITAGQVMQGGAYGGPAPASTLSTVTDGSAGLSSAVGGIPLWEWIVGAGVLFLVLLFAMRR